MFISTTVFIIGLPLKRNVLFDANILSFYIRNLVQSLLLYR